MRATRRRFASVAIGVAAATVVIILAAVAIMLDEGDWQAPVRSTAFGPRYIPGLGFVLLLAVATVGLVSLVGAIRSGRALRAQQRQQPGAPKP
jgi:hypothetical protein